MRAIEWHDGDITIIDQVLLPHREERRKLRTTDDVAEAITSLRVRGAPALGIIGAMGVAQAAHNAGSKLPDAVMARAREAGRLLAATRPTAVNLQWGIDRVLAKARLARTNGRRDLPAAMVEEALSIQSEDEKACYEMSAHALEFFPRKGVVLTHCNTGFLCTGGYGTALGAIRRAHEEGHSVVTLATETRPLLQGARLTVWELKRLGIPHALVVDSAAPGLIARGEVALVIVGADRIAANGDVANKVGTYPLALAAREAGVPFVVVAPTSTIDMRVRDAASIPVEERPGREVTWVLGAIDIAPLGTEAVNPAFDLTPAGLVTAIVTERGVARPPFARSLVSMTSGTRTQAKSKARAPSAKPASKRAPSKPARSKAQGAKKAGSGRAAATSRATTSRAPAKPAKRATVKSATKAKTKTAKRPVRGGKRLR